MESYHKFFISLFAYHLLETAFDGTDSEHFYRTPVEFFGDGLEGVVGVLDRQNIPRRVVGSGARVFIPDIPGIYLIKHLHFHTHHVDLNQSLSTYRY